MSDLYQNIKEFNEYHNDINETCDVVVVGSGPAGAVMAYNLVEAGLDVVLLEAGPIRRPTDFVLDGGRTLAETGYEGGVRASRGNIAMPTIQARVLGGGSHINSAMCLRTPEFCFDDWKNSYGVQSIDRSVLDPHYDRIEKFLGIAPTDEKILGRRNELFREACDKLGMSSAPTPRNVVGCDGCAECFTGCPTRAKQSMDISYIPAAVKKGLKVFTSVQVTTVVHAGGIASGVKGVTVHPHPAKKARSFAVNIKAKKVVLAAGCIATPVLLQKSNAPDPYSLIGANLQAHPGAAMLGIFEEEVNPWFGATQGYHSLEYLERGYKLEVLWAPPAVLAVRFPGFGAEFKQYLSDFKHGAVWDAFFSLKHSSGSVRAKPGKSMHPDIKYHLSPLDMPTIREGMAKLMELFFAAGATRVLPGVHGFPDVVTDSSAIKQLQSFNLKPGDIVTASTHLFSTTRLGPDPSSSVVSENGEMHFLKNCYICDTGVMPKSPAVNPMLTGMALSDLFSAGVIESVAGS